MDAVPRLGLVLDQILFHHDGRWSTDEVFIRFVERLARTRFDRVAFCTRVRASGAAAPYELDPALFEVVPLPWYADVPSLFRAPWLMPRIARVLSRVVDDADLVIASGIHPVSVLALRTAQKKGRPAVLWIRGNLLADLDHRASGLRRVAARLAARACIAAIPRGTPVVCMGRDDFDFLRRMGPVQVAYSSKFGLAEVLAAPRPEHEAPGPARLLYVGRLAPEKGLEVLFDALRRMRAAGAPAPVLTIVGDDFFGSTYGAELRRATEASDLAPAVRFLGHVPYGPRLLEIYDAHDALVLPSFTEGFPQVLLEAMARGAPIVATAVGGVPRLVKDGVNGLLVPPGDPAALAAALARLGAEPALAAALAARGLETARRFTSEVQVAAVGGFLDRVAGSRA